MGKLYLISIILFTKDRVILEELNIYLFKVY